MITLFSSGFSPFCRKIQMVLEYKKLDFDVIEVENENSVADFRHINPRKEVPVLVDDDITVANSSDIVSFLDYKYPDNPVLPASLRERVLARKWERISDTTVDAIVVNLTIWGWANLGKMPDGLHSTAKSDLEQIYTELNDELEGKDFICGDLSIADIALFPHLGSVKLLGLPFSQERHPNLYTWLGNMRELPIVQSDVNKTKAWLETINTRPLERNKIAWRGDRLEWLMAKGFHKWFYTQIEQDKVIWPV